MHINYKILRLLKQLKL